MVAKYLYKGISLRKYCIENHLDYSKYLHRVESLIKNEKLTANEAVKKAIEEYKDSRCNFYYDGISLRQYCEQHGYNYQIIYLRVKNMDNQEEINRIIKEFITNNPKEKREIYNIDGLSLRQYCKKNGLTYPTIKTYIQNLLKEDPNLSRSEVVKKAIKYYKEKHVPKERYFYQKERLVDYCKKNNYEYKNMVGYLEKYVKDTYNITEEELKRAIYKYEIKLRKDAFNSLNNKESLEECYDLLKTLNIDIDSVKLVMNFNFSFKEAILFVWYFGNEISNQIIIDTKEIKEVYNNLNNLESLELNELIGYYKTKIFDTRNIIYDKTFLSIRKVVSTLLVLKMI